jgi:HpaII restriction endonuclease
MNASSQITGNKGEWSELYALLKLLADGQLRPGDADLQALPDKALKILSVARSDTTGVVQYKLDGKKISIKSANGNSEIATKDCAKWAQMLLTAIQADSVEKGAKAIPEASEWMQALRTTSLKAKSTDKADVEIVLHDLHTGAAPQLGFSVKSYLGGAPTLLNASTHTNFVYPIPNCNANQQAEFNNALSSDSFTTAFATLPINGQPNALHARVDSIVFGQNFALLDCQLQTIIGHLLSRTTRGSFEQSMPSLRAT